MRTLRDLGVDLATIRRVLDEVTVADVAAAHAAAIDAQIRVLRVQKAVLGAVARRGSDPKEMQRMHRLAQLSDDERKRIVSEFLDQAFDGLDIEPGFAERMRSAAPALPDDPTPEQVDAWIELAELVQDPAFIASIRRTSEQHSAARQAGESTEPQPDWQAAAALVNERAGAALDAGRPRRALLAAAGDRQRLAAGADHRSRLGVADRGTALGLTPPTGLDMFTGQG